MEDAKEQIKKVNVGSDQELTDIVRIVQSAKEGGLVLIFTEHSDLLVSPINLQVIQETADEMDIPIVFQIIDNRAGIRNVSEIGATYSDSADPISNELWEKSFTQMVQRRNATKDALRRTGGIMTHKLEEDASKEDGFVDNHEVFPEPTKAEIIKLNNPATDGLDTVDEIGDDISPEDMKLIPDPEEKPKSAFSERIDAALERSKLDLKNNKNQTVEQGGIRIAVAHDIDEDGSIPQSLESSQKTVSKQPERPMSLTGRDFMGKAVKPEPQKAVVDNAAMPKVDMPKNPYDNKPQRFPEKPKQISNSAGGEKTAAMLRGIMSGLKKFFTTTLPAVFKSKAFKKIGLLAVIPLLLVAGIAVYIVYTYTPLVNVDIYIESRPVAAEKTFTGTPETVEFDLEAANIPVKKESVTKERSDSTNATGTATRGTKASGIVRFQCTDPGTRVLPAGTVVTASAEGLAYILVGEASFDCPTVAFPTATAEADDVGAEYNISSGILMSVGAAGEPTVIAITETSFTGGNKEDYTIISQGDYDRVVNPLKEVAYKESKDDLEALATDGWEIIPSTIKHELDGVIESDFPIGAEADILNVTVKTKSSALYFKKAELEAAAKDILLDEAKGQNLFDTENDLDLKLGDDFISDISVDKVEGNTVTVKLTLSGAVKPSVSDNEILAEIEGKDWDTGLKYLSNLTFVAKDTEVSFKPDYFPKGLRYFPSRQGRILIDIHDVEPEVIVPEETE